MTNHVHKNIIQHKKKALTEYAGNKVPDQTAHAQSDQGLRFPLTKSVDTVEYVECPNQTVWRLYIMT